MSRYIVSANGPQGELVSDLHAETLREARALAAGLRSKLLRRGVEVLIATEDGDTLESWSVGLAWVASARRERGL